MRIVNKARTMLIACTVVAVIFVGAAMCAIYIVSQKGDGAQESGASYSLTVDLDHPGKKGSPLLYGAFYEEINHAGDGGLYAELISNRSFEDDPEAPANWWIEQTGGSQGTLRLTGQSLLNGSQTRALEMTVTKESANGKVSALNYGYWGIPLVKGGTYELSLYAKQAGEIRGELEVALESIDGKKIFAEGKTDRLTGEWQRYKLNLTSTEQAPNARIRISAHRQGTVYLDMVSLFPQTWKNRQNGLRPDLAELVAGMSPRFLRFPGGCFVEGLTPEHAYQWKKTIGPVEERPGHIGYWNYRSTDGLGFHEMLQWAEDLKAEPLYVVNVGISHNGDPFTKAEFVPLADIQPWIQDALDAIEYANGPVTSYWGAQRAANGHPEPFHLKYIEVGNENNFQPEEYMKRYPLFYNAIKAKYPDIQIIANAAVQGAPVEIVDEHYYESAQWFMDHSNQYDAYDRNGPKIYVGEYAVTKNAGKGNMEAALGEAAFMTGMERNSDIVVMSSYAPLLVNEKDRTWNPDAIVFNAESSYGTPSYHVQKMFANNNGDTILSAELKPLGKAEDPASIQGGIGVGTWATQAEYQDIKVTQSGKTLFADSFRRDDTNKWAFSGGDWERAEGRLKQSAAQTDVRATAGDPSWSDYTLTLKARKTGGAEGMLIMFGSKDHDDFYWWNLGGWGNTRSAIEKSVGGSRGVIGASVPLQIETGRWYDIKIELQGTTIRAYLDGKLIHEINDVSNAGPLFQSASLDSRTGDVIIKVVNASDSGQTTELHVGRSGTKEKWHGTANVLQAEYLTDENSFSEPGKVSPRSADISFEDNVFVYTFPKYSVTILRLKSHPM